MKNPNIEELKYFVRLVRDEFGLDLIGNGGGWIKVAKRAGGSHIFQRGEAKRFLEKKYGRPAFVDEMRKQVADERKAKLKPYMRPGEVTITRPGRPTMTSKEFFCSREWKELRYRVIQTYGARCQCCGATAGDGVQIHVDHIKPRSKFPNLELVFSNLQVLCEPCNVGKSNTDQTDWRAMEPTEFDIAGAAHLKTIQ